MITYGDMLNVVMVVVNMEVDKVAAEVVDFWYSQERVCVCVSDLWNASHYMQKRQSYQVLGDCPSGPFAP